MWNSSTLWCGKSTKSLFKVIIQVPKTLVLDCRWTYSYLAGTHSSVCQNGCDGLMLMMMMRRRRATFLSRRRSLHPEEALGGAGDLEGGEESVSLSQERILTIRGFLPAYIYSPRRVSEQHRALLRTDQTLAPSRHWEPFKVLDVSSMPFLLNVFALLCSILLLSNKHRETHRNIFKAHHKLVWSQPKQLWDVYAPLTAKLFKTNLIQRQNLSCHGLSKTVLFAIVLYVNCLHVYNKDQYIAHTV